MREDFSSSGIVVQILDDNSLPLEPLYSSDEPYRFCFYSEDCLCHSFPVLVSRQTCPRSVIVNGHNIDPVADMHLTSPEDACYIVSDIFHDGYNSIELNGCEGMPNLCVAGDFSVQYSDSVSWYIARERELSVGDLSLQGLPFYDGEVSYSCLYDIPQMKRFRILHIPSWKGSSCQLFVNGEFVPDIRSKHSIKNIAPWLKAGTNCIELRIRAYPSVIGENVPHCWGLMKDFKLRGAY